MQKTLRQHLEMVYKSRISAGNLCCTVSQERFLVRKCVSVRCRLFLGVECCATFQAALYIETYSMMHQSEFHAANVALSRAADKISVAHYIFITTGIPKTLRAHKRNWNCSHLYVPLISISEPSLRYYISAVRKIAFATSPNARYENSRICSS